jgi:hypothetical protein
VPSSRVPFGLQDLYAKHETGSPSLLQITSYCDQEMIKKVLNQDAVMSNGNFKNCHHSPSNAPLSKFFREHAHVFLIYKHYLHKLDTYCFQCKLGQRLRMLRHLRNAVRLRPSMVHMGQRKRRFNPTERLRSCNFPKRWWRSLPEA